MQNIGSQWTSTWWETSNFYITSLTALTPSPLNILEEVDKYNAISEGFFTTIFVYIIVDIQAQLFYCQIENLNKVDCLP